MQTSSHPLADPARVKTEYAAQVRWFEDSMPSLFDGLQSIAIRGWRKSFGSMAWLADHFNCGLSSLKNCGRIDARILHMVSTRSAITMVMVLVACLVL